MSEEQQINEYKKMVASLKNTIGNQAVEHATSIAERDSIIQNIGEELNAVKEELDKLKKEHMQKLDEEA